MTDEGTFKDCVCFWHSAENDKVAEDVCLQA